MRSAAASAAAVGGGVCAFETETEIVNEIEIVIVIVLVSAPGFSWTLFLCSRHEEHTVFLMSCLFRWHFCSCTGCHVG